MHTHTHTDTRKEERTEGRTDVHFSALEMALVIKIHGVRSRYFKKIHVKKNKNLITKKLLRIVTSHEFISVSTVATVSRSSVQYVNSHNGPEMQVTVDASIG